MSRRIPAVTRRQGRVSGASAWSPEDLPGFLLWLRADVGTPASWTPIAGAYTPEQAVAGNRPTATTSATLSNHPVFDYDGSDDFLRATGLSLTSCTVFAACVSNANNSGAVALTTGAVNTGVAIFMEGGSWKFRRIGTGDVVITGSLGDAAILCGAFEQASGDGYLNSLTPSSSAVDVGPLATSTDLVIGQLDGGIYPHSGPIAEIIMCSGKLTQAHVAPALRYLAARYGVTLS